MIAIKLRKLLEICAIELINKAQRNHKVLQGKVKAVKSIYQKM